jgi:hypothetical protein
MSAMKRTTVEQRERELVEQLQRFGISIEATDQWYLSAWQVNVDSSPVRLAVEMEFYWDESARTPEQG